MRNVTKLICGIAAAAVMLTACGSGSSEAKVESTAVSSAAEETVEATPTPEPTERPTPEPTEMPTVDDLDATQFKLADLTGMIGKSKDDIKAAYPDTTFIKYNNDTYRMATKAEVVGSECTVIIQFVGDKSEAVIVHYDVSNATSYLVGETYMKIRNTICQSMGDPVLAYDPVYTEVSASQIGMAFEDGKEVEEQWEGSDYKAEMYVVNAEDSLMLVAFYTPVYEASQGL